MDHEVAVRVGQRRQHLGEELDATLDAQACASA